MAGQASTVGAGYALDAIGGVGVPARTTYIALLTAAPTAGTTMATMVELIAEGYVRQAVAWTVPSGTPRVTSNSNALSFGPFAADPAAVSHLGLVSAQAGTSGDFLWLWDNTVIDAIINETITAKVGALTRQIV